jgi:hypothetical protein
MTQTTAGTTTYQTLHDDRGNVIYHHPDPLSCFPDLLRECSAAGIQYTWVDLSVLPRDCLAYQVVHDLDLTNMTLSNMNLAGTVFRRCGLRHVKVSKCMLQGTRFDHCDMNNIYIHYPPIMQDVSFIRCGMEHAVIRGASINGLRADHCPKDAAVQNWRQASTAPQELHHHALPADGRSDRSPRAAL